MGYTVTYSRRYSLVLSQCSEKITKFQSLEKYKENVQSLQFHQKEKKIPFNFTEFIETIFFEESLNIAAFEECRTKV